MNEDQKAIHVHRALRQPTNDDPELVHLHSASNEEGPCACGAQPPGSAKTVQREEFWHSITCQECRVLVKDAMAARVDSALTRGRNW